MVLGEKNKEAPNDDGPHKCEPGPKTKAEAKVFFPAGHFLVVKAGQ
jgi:hypothetical protein